MILVRILGFGSNWWARYGRDPEDRYRYTRRAAYFNSAGVRCGSKIRRHWIVSGLIRFNGAGDFNPQFTRRLIGSTFECTDPAFACGGNRVVFLRRARVSAEPDYYLVAIPSDRFGVMDFGNADWKSRSVLPIAVSRLGQKQEAVLLMKSGDFVRTDLGTWRLIAEGSNTNGALLEFTRVRP